MANSIISKVYLLDTPLKNDYKDTFYFTSKSTQESYFQSRVKHTFNNVSYVRKEQVIKLNVQYDTICTCNYLMYQNTAYSNKWMYCFIKSMKYISEGVTEIEIETDVIQTYLFDYEVHRSFVEREHVSDDTIGNHTQPETLETGNYICNEKIVDTIGQELFIYMAYSDFSQETSNVKGDLHGGIYSGMGYSAYNITTDGINNLNTTLKDYDKENKADAINSIFMGPQWLSGHVNTGKNQLISMLVEKTDAPKTYNPIPINKQTSLNGYTPRNKKLLCYPYNYLYVTNNNGNNAIYQYEYFSEPSCNFEVKGVLTPGCSIRMNPQNYKGVELNNEEGINAGKYPICCWNSDAYTNWLTQNGVNNALGIATGIGQILVGAGVMVGTAGVGALVGGGTIAGGVSTITSVLSQKHQASMMPDQAKGNTNCGDVITGNKNNCFMFYKMSITSEYAKVIDDYFDMFGYKINVVKVPNKNHRSQHWYTKTIDANITGEIPGTDLQKIKDCYNQGISFWKNPANIYRYDLANGIS